MQTHAQAQACKHTQTHAHLADGEVANTTDGSPKRLRGEVALGRLRVDGTISIDGPYGQAGNLTTKALVFSGEKLRLNVDAGGGGAVTVSIYTPRGERLLGPSEPIVHSAVDEEVTWREGRLGHLARQQPAATTREART